MSMEELGPDVLAERAARELQGRFGIDHVTLQWERRRLADCWNGACDKKLGTPSAKARQARAKRVVRRNLIGHDREEVMNQLFEFLASSAGRILRAVAGLILIALGIWLVGGVWR